MSSELAFFLTTVAGLALGFGIASLAYLRFFMQWHKKYYEALTQIHDDHLVADKLFLQESEKAADLLRSFQLTGVQKVSEMNMKDAIDQEDDS